MIQYGSICLGSPNGVCIASPRAFAMTLRSIYKTLRNHGTSNYSN
jgi:hypothetical protein